MDRDDDALYHSLDARRAAYDAELLLLWAHTLYVRAMLLRRAIGRLPLALDALAELPPGSRDDVFSLILFNLHRLQVDVLQLLHQPPAADRARSTIRTRRPRTLDDVPSVLAALDDVVRALRAEAARFYADPLTPTQRAVLEYYRAGQPAREIAEQLLLSEGRVKNIITEVRHTLGDNLVPRRKRKKS